MDIDTLGAAQRQIIENGLETLAEAGDDEVTAESLRATIYDQVPRMLRSLDIILRTITDEDARAMLQAKLKG